MSGWRYYKRKPRRWPWVAAGALALVLAAIGGAYWHYSKPEVMQRLLLGYLQSRVVTPTLVITHSGPGRVVLEKLSLGSPPDASIDKAELTYGLTDLLSGRVGTLTLEGVRLTAVRTDAGWSLGSLDAFTGGGGSGGPVVLPFQAVKIRRGEATVVFDTRHRETVPFAVELENKGDAAEISAVVPEAGWQKQWHVAGLMINARLPLDPAGPLTVTATAEKLESGEGWFAPLAVQAEAGRAAAAQDIVFSGEAQDAGGRFRLSVKGARAPGGAVTADVTTAPLTFEPGVLQPDQLFPKLGTWLSGTRGTVAVSGPVRWDGASPPSGNLTFTFADLSTQLRSTTLTGVNGAVTVTGFAPLATAPSQQLKVGLLEAGVPLTNGVLTFTLTPKGVLEVAPTRWQWAGGSVGTEAASIDLDRIEAGGLTLTMSDVELNQLLGMIMKEGLSATGRLQGRLPVRYQEGAWIIENGLLETPEEGVIRYKPDTGSPLQTDANPQVTMLLHALENFHYTRLRLTIMSRPDGIMKLVMAISGNNPDRFGGKPINLNINLEGKLIDMIAAELRAADMESLVPAAKGR